MIKIFIGLFLLFSFSTIVGQTEQDSLIKAIKDHPQKDTTRCLLLLDYYEENRKDKDVQQVNLDLKQLLLEIISNPSLQQTDKKWYVRLLLSALLYEGQDILKYTANYTRALDSFFEMLKYAEEIDDDEGRAGALNDISTTYFKQKYYKESIAYCLKFIALSRQSNDSVFISSGLSNIAYTYLTIGETDKAEKSYKEALIIKERVEPNRLGVIYNGLGNVWKKRGNLDSALAYYEKALNLNYALHLKKLYVRNYANIAQVYLEKRQLNKAEEFALHSFKIAEEIKEPEHIKSATGILSEIYSAQGRYKDAYEMIKLSSLMKDSIVNDENKQSLLKAEINYQTQLKESEITQLEQKNQITTLQSERKNLIIYAIIFLSGIIAAAAWLIFSKYKTKKQTEFLKAKLEDAELLLIEKQKASNSEIKAIKSQMNPHFFYNALNSIQAYIYNGDKENAAKSLGLFSDLSRSVLESSRNNEISLFDELELLENYLRLETMRLPKIKYKVQIDESIQLHDSYIPSMILQPLVENAIKHGLANKQGEGLLSIKFQKQNDELLVEIDDNGIGRLAAAEISKRMVKKSASFSTDANMNRIELLNQNKTVKISQEIIDKNDSHGEATGTTIRLVIPIEI